MLCVRRGSDEGAAQGDERRKERANAVRGQERAARPPAASASSSTATRSLASPSRSPARPAEVLVHPRGPSVSGAVLRPARDGHPRFVPEVRDP